MGWSNFHVPEGLADPMMRDLLRVHGRVFEGSPVTVARAARDLLRDKIEALAPGEGALVVSYVQACNLELSAARLAMSSRQVTRERTRAVRLLRAELEAYGGVH